MKTNSINRAVLAAVSSVLWLLLIVSTQAAPGILGHQGHIEVDGVPFKGTGSFKFALVNAAGTTTFWSNDNTSGGGSQPTAAVSLTVNNGAYSVLLGDTTLVNMEEVPFSVFAENDDVRLRIWFNDGSNGFQQLLPDRRIAAVGYALSLPHVDFSNENTAIGIDALDQTTGEFNSAFGEEALRNNTTGDGNTAMGAQALLNNTTGATNTATGQEALLSNTTGQSNTATGALALHTNTTGFTNTATGVQSLQNNTTGALNTGTGVNALRLNTAGQSNTAVGYSALNSNTTASFNSAFGRSALTSNTTGTQNTAAGSSALLSNTTGDFNIGVGALALNANTTGTSNTVVGYNAMADNTTGGFNIAIGRDSGSALTTGNGNIVIGHPGEAGDSATIRIGHGHTRAFMGGIRGVTTGQANAVTVMIDSNGQLGTVSSSRRYKRNIRPMQESGVSERLRQLRPVTFEYKQEQNGGEHPVQFGLIAEEVAEVFPELAVFNEYSEPETVKYHLLAPMLLNELQRERSLRESETADLKARLARLEALLEASLNIEENE